MEKVTPRVFSAFGLVWLSRCTGRTESARRGRQEKMKALMRAGEGGGRRKSFTAGDPHPGGETEEEKMPS